MKKAEKETIIRSVGRRCRGSHSGLGTALKRFEREKAAAEVAVARGNESQQAAVERAQADIAAITEAAEGLNDPTVAQVVVALLDSGARDLAVRLDKRAREGCGQDINDLILAHPLDGLPKAEECPGCGRLVTWTPQDLDGADEVPEGFAHLFEEDDA
jgi:hypothetical protein